MSRSNTHQSGLGDQPIHSNRNSVFPYRRLTSSASGDSQFKEFSSYILCRCSRLNLAVNKQHFTIFTDVNGDKVTVENVAINAAGEWVINATDISELADGEITAEVSALDIEGNLATNSTTFTKDTTINIDISYLISTSTVVSPLEGTLRFGLTFNFGDEYDEY